MSNDTAKTSSDAPELERLGDATRAADAGATIDNATGKIDPDGGPDDADGKRAESPAQDSLALAVILVEIAAKLVQVRWPVLVYAPETRTELAVKADAVIGKYIGRVDFLARWREEFEFGAVLAGVIWESVERVNAAKPAPAKAGDVNTPDTAPPPT